MGSELIICSVEKLGDSISKAVNSFKGEIGIYISLNKTSKGSKDALKKAGIDAERLFFIDCVSSEGIEKDSIHIKPNELEKLGYATNCFIKYMKGKTFLIIDSVATLLIYNDENKVAGFVKKITEYASRKNVSVIALSQKTTGEELLGKIYNFFDEVKKTQ